MFRGHAYYLRYSSYSLLSAETCSSGVNNSQHNYRTVLSLVLRQQSVTKWCCLLPRHKTVQYGRADQLQPTREPHSSLRTWSEGRTSVHMYRGVGAGAESTRTLLLRNKLR